ncbi:pantetheine-phosphate adenylyltransferase [Kamptonema cortianum]|nr:pantetheine-phosphate adenylyltransferase [Geitlerinema splendidum]MDK3155291.1 pantetheine-phosphate adenylyltransferase [Kamptonema cortianum]
MTRLAIYPGSFDPPTNGHLDLIERSSKLFDHVIVGIGVNTEKSPFLSVEDRLESLKECCQPYSNVSVETFSGLLVHFARDRECKVLVRGLRAITDYDYEFRIALANRRLAPEIETIFLIAREEFSFLASSVVREVARLNGDYKQFVPPPVAEKIEKSYKN